MTAIVAAIGWLAGLLAAPALPPLDPATAALLLVAVVGLGCLSRAAPAGGLAAVALVGGLLAVMRAQAAGGPPGPGSVLDYADLGVDFELRGRVVAEPERADRGTRLRVAALEVRSAAIAGTTFGDVQALAPGDAWRYGDLVWLRGRLERPVDRDDIPLADVFARRGLLASMRAVEAGRLTSFDQPVGRATPGRGDPSTDAAPPARGDPSTDAAPPARGDPSTVAAPSARAAPPATAARSTTVDPAPRRPGEPSSDAPPADAPPANAPPADAPSADAPPADAPPADAARPARGDLDSRSPNRAADAPPSEPARTPPGGLAPRHADAGTADAPPVRAPPSLESLRGALYDARAAASAALDRRLPAPTAALARGLLLGGTSGMPPDLVEAFRRAGLTHVVAVSGYNITLVAAALAPLARLTASRAGSVALPSLAILGFTLAVGAPASAVRAAIMGCLVLLAGAVGRPPDAVAGLAVAALLMTLADPGLIDDLGFVLSSLATLAIVTVYPWLDAALPGPRATVPGLTVQATAGLGLPSALVPPPEAAHANGEPASALAPASEAAGANGEPAPALVPAPEVARAGDPASALAPASTYSPRAPSPLAPPARLTGVPDPIALLSSASPDPPSTLSPPRRLASNPTPVTLAHWLLTTARETVVATLAVELLAVPLIGATFGRVSIVSPLANLLVLPLVPLAMATSLPLAVAGALPDWLIAPLTWAAWAPLAWIVAAVEACAGPAWASLPVGRLPSALVWAYYTVAAPLLLTAHAGSYRLAFPSPAALTRGVFDRLPAGIAIATALLASLVAWAGAFSVPESAPRLTFFEDSGATLLQTAAGRAVLIEPGPSGRAVTADLGRVLPFWSTAIDLLILPRGEAESLPELLRRYPVAQIVAPEPPDAIDDEPSGAARWRDAAAAAGVPVATPPDGTSVPLGDGAVLDLLQPTGPDAPYAVRLVAGPHRVLLLGEASAAAQRALRDLVDAPVDVVRLPFDAAPLDPTLRDRLAPRLAIVHVRPSLPPRGAPRPDERLQVLRSDDRGTIALTLRSGGLEVRARR